MASFASEHPLPPYVYYYSSPSTTTPYVYDYSSPYVYDYSSPSTTTQSEHSLPPDVYDHSSPFVHDHSSPSTTTQSEHSLPPDVYSSPSTTTQRGDGNKRVQEPDIKTYVKFIDDKLKNSTSATGRNEAPKFFIPKIPEILRRGKNDKNDNEPKIISIGPYHRGQPRLQSMEVKKFQSLGKMLFRTGLELDHFVAKLLPLEDQVRRCYSDELAVVQSKDFVEMMLLDSCFILHLLLQVRNDATKLDGMSWIAPLLFNDLLLLENQLPFFLVQRVFEISGEYSSSLVKIALDFYHVVSETVVHPNEEMFTPPVEEVHHLLQLYHWFHIIPLIGVSTQKPSKSEWINFLPIFHDCTEQCLKKGQNNDEESGITIPSATALHEAGIKFKTKKGNCILDVNFSDGVLEIPYLLIQHGAFSVFRSLIALEQCYDFYNNNLPQLTVYFYFMDHIINTVNDVSLLQKSGIIEYAHGSEEEVAELFNQLTRGATINPNNYLSGLYKDVNRYSKKKRNIWRAILLRRHFSNPWTILSLIGALILLVLTFIQSYFSVYAYFRPPSTSPS